MQNVSGGTNMMSPPTMMGNTGTQSTMGMGMMAPANLTISNMDTMNNNSIPVSNNNAQKPANNAFGDLKW